MIAKSQRIESHRSIFLILFFAITGVFPEKTITPPSQPDKNSLEISFPSLLGQQPPARTGEKAVPYTTTTTSKQAGGQAAAQTNDAGQDDGAGRGDGGRAGGAAGLGRGRGRERGSHARGRRGERRRVRAGGGAG